MSAAFRSRIISVFRGAVCFAVFLGAFAAVSGAIGRALPFPEVPIVRSKVEHLQAFHDKFDTLIIGSSRLAYQIFPAQFDESMAAGGYPTRTFNAAVAGMYPPEDGYMLETILQHPPKNLRLVILELAFLRSTVENERGTARSVYWHDWERLWLLCKRAYGEKYGARKKKLPLKQRLQRLMEPWPEVSEHLELFAQRSANLGRGNGILEEWLRPGASRGSGAVTLNPDFDGWSPASTDGPMAGVQLADFERGLGVLRAQPSVRDLSDPVSQEALQRMIARVEKLGAKVVLIAPPTTAKRTFYPLPEIAEGRIILEYSDIHKYPALYARENRLDTDHLNQAGSRIWTKTIAAELLAKLPRK